MLKKLLTACAIVIALAPQANAAPDWENVGKTSTDETLSLDITSVQNKPHSGGWLFFVYRLTGSVETRQSVAKTASCSGGKLSSAKPGWIIDSTGRQVYADSVGSQNLLQRVCKLGKNAYSISDYKETYELENVSQNTQNEEFFINSVDKFLALNKNPALNIFTAVEKIQFGKAYCDYRATGASRASYYYLLSQSTNYKNLDLPEKTIIDDYRVTITSMAGLYLCPEFKN